MSTGTTVQFSCDLSAGIFGFKFYYVGTGYATCSDTVSIQIIQPTLSQIQASYNGGTLSFTGSGISPSATLNFGGFKTPLSQINSTSAVGTIPPFINELTQNHYTLTNPKKLTRNEFALISDSGNAEKAFDSLHGTSYISSSSACFVGIDVGSELVLNLTRVRFFPHSQWLIVADYLIDARIEASNDGVNY